jgi:transposase
MPIVADHQCEYQEQVGAALTLAADLAAELDVERAAAKLLQTRVDRLEQALFGKSSEKMPTPDEEIRRSRPGKKRKPKDGKKARAAAAEVKKSLPEVEVVHKVGDDASACASCGKKPSRQVGEGKVSHTFDWEPGRFIKRKHVRRVAACSCGAHIVTAEGPAKVIDKGRYGAGFIAHVITAKCADSLPLYRLSKRYRRHGVPVARSTMNDLFHRSAELLSPLHARILELIAQQDVVLADETTMPIQQRGKCKNGWSWAFLGGGMIGFRFSSSRSGATPLDVLGGTTGTLLVDAYTGYNQVCGPDGRERAACVAHARRKFFEALQDAPVEAKEAMALILEAYRVEREAAESGAMGSDKHLATRQSRSKPAMEELFRKCQQWQPQHVPKGPMGAAIRYALNNREELSLFLGNASVPIDNNAAERGLRTHALGRKNFLFVGHVQGGKNLAVLYTMVANCELRGINPLDYLTDILIRVQDTPQSRIDELLPWNWKPPDSGELAAA